MGHPTELLVPLDKDRSKGFRSRAAELPRGVSWSIGEVGQSFIIAFWIVIEDRYESLLEETDMRVVVRLG